MAGPALPPAEVLDSHTAGHALHHTLIMTKDLEELMDNVNIAEVIARRPSRSTMASNNSESIASVFSPRSTRIIEPIPAFRSRKKDSPTLSEASVHSLAALKQNIAHCNGAIEKDVASNKQRRFSAQLATRGSLTTSEEDEVAETWPKGPASSYSATGAMVTSLATQTPEQVDSSDSEQAATEPETTHRGGPSSVLSSTSSSTSSEEEWDSEADTHTSLSDEEGGRPSKKKAPTVSYYQVVGKEAASALKATTNAKGRQSRSPVPAPNANQHVRPVSAPQAQRQPWLERLQQGRRPNPPPPPLPARFGLPPPRPPTLFRTQSAVSSSRSFPQGFPPTDMPLSNPFFSTSLQEAYRQACSFKLWYEEYFPEQVGTSSIELGVGNGVTGNRRTSSSASAANGPSAPLVLPSTQFSKAAQASTQRLYSR
ncbi:hypothetical protein RvY_17122-2 [Ramazzottius varieornatus]|nr:hypothetical protein RvY_17122-2 [Ramazzottius varieornatus]